MRGLFIFSFLFILLSSTAKLPEGITFPKSSATVSSYHIKITGTKKNTFGYEIYKDNKLLIQQPTIPGIPGTKGFRSKTDAQKVASLAVSKIMKGIMPPTIDKKELEHMHIHL